ncbi:alpha-mannosidase [Clostridium sp.]|uniref:alpha-mannosidase n=1 Tax=Clostridium sp. TaxID=1506 RepID=UPI003FD83345
MLTHRETEGGMWVEADCNLTSGESLVRQFLYGKQFFKDEFGSDNKILWLPDVFGYSAALPQIMNKCGIKYFMTTKIAWNEFNEFPYDTFWWHGIDGTPIFTHLITTKEIDQDKESFFTTYNGMLHPAALMGGWDRYQQKELNNDILVCYGYGDGGGGPTREMLETGRRLEKGIIGAPKVRHEFSKTYFDELYESLNQNHDVPKWIGELYLECHRGTYTSMSRNKRSNRKSEFSLMNLEMLSVWAEQYGIIYPKEEIDAMWKMVLLNQFHDILPGSAIKEVYEVTKVEYEEIKRKSGSLTKERLDAIASAAGAGKDNIAVFNTLSFERRDKVVLDNIPLKVTELVSKEGVSYPLQKTEDGKAVAWVEGIPSKGLKVLKFSEGKNSISPFIITESGIETPYYKISINSGGFFTSLYDKRCNREVLQSGEKGNLFRVYEDKPREFDNWNIDIYYDRKSWIADDITKLEWVENGPVQAVLLTERRYCNSCVKQKIYFYANSPRIDFETYVDWKEHQQLMKVEFPIDVNANEATYDIQFGNITRPTHCNTSWDMAKFEVCAHKWADISDGGYGVSLLNDCKYGYSVKNQTMALSLIKSGIDPNPTTDQEEHWFTYAILPHSGSWKEGDTVREAYMLNLPLLVSYTERKSNFIEGITSLFNVDAKNVILETIKKAENRNGTILRIYEFENRRSDIKISFNVKCRKVTECDLLENDIVSIANEAQGFSFTIKPFEIKTFRIS